MKVIILAGGFGTRLQSVVHDVPKPMADINGTPFLELLMANMLQYGASEFILCVSYMRDKIINYFGDDFRGVPVKYSIENEPLGTGGAIKQAFDLFSLDEAMVINGDSYIKMNYAEFYAKNQGNTISIALKYMPNASRYGIVETSQKTIIRFNEKSAENKPGLINAGIYLIGKNLWKFAPEAKKFSFEKDILETHISKLQASFYKTEDYFIDIGIPESYAKALKELKSIILPRTKALFMDRDGVINVDKNYVYKIADCEFIEGIFDFCQEAKEEGYKLIVITNQAGIAKNKYSKVDYFNLRDYIHKTFSQKGCALDAEYYCPYHPEAIIQEYKKDSYDRKPNPGMILKAAKDFNIDLEQSILIGDKESDIESAQKAGIGTSIRFIDENFIYEPRESKADFVWLNSLKEIKSLKNMKG